MLGSDRRPEGPEKKKAPARLIRQSDVAGWWVERCVASGDVDAEQSGDLGVDTLVLGRETQHEESEEARSRAGEATWNSIGGSWRTTI